MLLSFALLVAIGSATMQGFVPRSADAHQAPPAAGTATAAAASFTADIAALSARSGLTVASAAQCSRIMPPPPPLPRVHPKRGVIATTKDDAATHVLLALATAPAGNRPGVVVSSRIGEGASSTFIAHASRSSRTRGQPGSDC